MPDPAERFIAAATAPLADNAELQMTAEAELRDAFANGILDPKRAEGAAQILERKQRPGFLRRLLYGTVILVSLWALAITGRDYLRWKTACGTLFGVDDWINIHLPGIPFVKGPPMAEPGIFGKIKPADQLLLFGDLQVPPAVRYQSLSKRNPEDAAAYAEDAKQKYAWQKFPADFLDRADELDPDNGWFRYFAAGVAASESVQAIDAKGGTEYRIKDPARFADAIRLMEEAAAEPKFDSYRREMLLRRLKVLPPGEDALGRLFAHEYVVTEGPNDHFVHRQVAQAVGAKAREMLTAGDATGLSKLCKTWDLLARRVMDNAASTMPDVLWARIVVTEPPPRELAIAARGLGLETEAKRYEARASAIAARRTPHPAFAGWETVNDHGSIRERRSWWLPLPPPPFTDEELKPGRMADHAFVDRMIACAGWAVCLLFAALAAGCRFFRGRGARLLSLSLSRLAGMYDQAWITGAGVVLPFAIHFASRHLEGLAGLRWCIIYSTPGHLLGSDAALALMLALPVAMAQWRLARHLTGRSGPLWWTLPRAIILLAALAVWIFTCVRGDVGAEALPPGAWEAGLVITACCALHPVLAGLFTILCRPWRHALAALALSRMLVPAYLCGALLAAAASLLWHAEEKAWIGRDALTRIDPAIPAASRFHGETAEGVRREWIAILEGMPRE